MMNNLRKNLCHTICSACFSAWIHFLLCVAFVNRKIERSHMARPPLLCIRVITTRKKLSYQKVVDSIILRDSIVWLTSCLAICEKNGHIECELRISELLIWYLDFCQLAITLNVCIAISTYMRLPNVPKGIQKTNIWVFIEAEGRKFVKWELWGDENDWTLHFEMVRHYT